jgi:AbiJ-like protein
MDDALKNALWNVAYNMFWSRFSMLEEINNSVHGGILIMLWSDHFNMRVDELRTIARLALVDIKSLYVASNWASVYEFVEFIAECQFAKAYTREFLTACNSALEKHISAYRFVGATLAPITSEEEIAAVEQAMDQEGKFGPVATHLQTALARLADRPVADNRNSIKESVSAVEAACQIITGDPNATLGQALKKIGVHPALEKGFSAIYGYTSDADGIRHAILDEPSVDADDAKFFLVSCSAFVNYLIARSSSAAE